MFEILLGGINKTKTFTNFGIFDPGTDTAATSKATDKYDFVSDVTAASTSMSAYNSTGACGNREFGIFAGGLHNQVQNFASVRKYMYDNDTVVTGTALGLARHGVAAAGNASTGLITGGATNTRITDLTSFSSYTDKYAYSNNSVSASTLLVRSRKHHGAASNFSVAIFAGGHSSQGIDNFVEKYQHSANTTASVTTMSSARKGMGACGTPTDAYFICGEEGSNVTEIYPYATNTKAANSTLMQYGSSFGSACSHPEGGIYNSGGMTTYKLNFSTLTSVTGTKLKYARGYGSAVSSNPGGF